MSRAGTAGMTKILSYLRGYFAKAGEVIKSVNNQHADSDGNLDLRVVPAAQQLVTDDGKESLGTFIDRTTGGDESIGDGQVDVMQIRGNAVHTGVVTESITMTVSMTTRQEGQEEITAVIDEDAFKEAVSESGTTELVYTTEWSDDPEDYGVTVTGTPIAGDTITIVYVAGDRGTITVATPTAFRETGWNLYNHTLGYARVKKYDSQGLFAIAGSYTALQFSETLTGTKTDVGVSSGYFTIAKDGYIWVTGGNSTNTEIYMCWTDWINGHTGISWEAYYEDVLDLSVIMSSCFPNGLMAVKGIYDEINLQEQKCISRVQRITYSEEAAASAAATGRKWDADTSYIYLERATPLVTGLDEILDDYDSSETYAIGDLCVNDNGKIVRCISAIGVAEAYNSDHWREAEFLTANDHGLEIFDGTTVGVTLFVLYGENLVDKIRRDLPAGISANSDAIAKLDAGLAIIVTGDSCTTAVPAGGYAYIKNNTHGLTEGLYKNKSSSAFPTSGAQATSTYFEAVSKGGLNALNDRFTSLVKIVSGTSEQISISAGQNKWCSVPITVPQGYTAVAVSAIYFNGWQSFAIYQNSVSNSMISYALHNLSQYDATVTIEASALCVKTDVYG